MENTKYRETFVVLLKHGIRKVSDERGDAGPARAETCSVANLDHTMISLETIFWPFLGNTSRSENPGHNFSRFDFFTSTNPSLAASERGQIDD